MGTRRRRSGSSDKARPRRKRGGEAAPEGPDRRWMLLLLLLPVGLIAFLLLRPGVGIEVEVTPASRKIEVGSLAELKIRITGSVEAFREAPGGVRVTASSPGVFDPREAKSLGDVYTLGPKRDTLTFPGVFTKPGTHELVVTLTTEVRATGEREQAFTFEVTPAVPVELQLGGRFKGRPGGELTVRVAIVDRQRIPCAHVDEGGVLTFQGVETPFTFAKGRATVTVKVGEKLGTFPIEVRSGALRATAKFEARR